MAGKVAFLLGSESIKKFESGRIDETVKNSIYQFEYLRDDDREALINGVQFGIGKPKPVTIVNGQCRPELYRNLIEDGYIVDKEHVSILFGLSADEADRLSSEDGDEFEIANTWGNEDLFIKGVMIAAGNDDLFYEEEDGDLFQIV